MFAYGPLSCVYVICANYAYTNMAFKNMCVLYYLFCIYTGCAGKERHFFKEWFSMEKNPVDRKSINWDTGPLNILIEQRFL